MNRGFVFSLDAALAVIVLSLALSALFFLTSQSQESAAPQLMLKRLAGDSLALLDANGTFASMNSTLINSTLAAALPQQYSFNLSVEYYNYTNSSGFVSHMNISAGSQFPDGQDSAESSRIFLVYNSTGPQQYGVAAIRVWRQ